MPSSACTVPYVMRTLSIHGYGRPDIVEGLRALGFWRRLFIATNRQWRTSSGPTEARLLGGATTCHQWRRKKGSEGTKVRVPWGGHPDPSGLHPERVATIGGRPGLGDRVEGGEGLAGRGYRSEPEPWEDVRGRRQGEFPWPSSPRGTALGKLRLSPPGSTAHSVWLGPYSAKTYCSFPSA